jgi:hypothetical protein
LLIPQDSTLAGAHVTIQNKVEPRERQDAAGELRELRAARW